MVGASAEGFAALAIHPQLLATLVSLGYEEPSVGAIQIADKHALVEVPAGSADEIAHALRAAKIRGKRLRVRRESEP